MAAKFHRSAPSVGTIPRRRALARIDARPAPAIASVVAPPGYGKTTLLTHWAAGHGDVAWLTVDDFDNTPSVLVAYLAAAIDHVEPLTPDSRRALSTGDPRVLSRAVPRLASELHRWGRPGALVIDDVHRLVDRTCLDALASLAEHLPDGFRLILAGRSTPDLPLGRWRAQRRLVDVDQADLALDVDEAAAIAAGAGWAPSRSEAEELVARSEGWAAAVYLAALARARGADGPGEAGDAIGLSGRAGYLADYLDAEFRPDLDERDVDVLTRTAILDVVEPDLAARVSAIPDASARLERVARTNRLVARVGGPDGPFRYHHLLRDHLDAELDHREPLARSGLHRRAADWYAEARQPGLAIEHAFAGGDIDRAAGLIEANGIQTFLLGHGDRLERWFNAMDPGVYVDRPSLAFVAALVHGLSGQPDAAERMAAIVEHARPGGGPPLNGTASLESFQAILRAVTVRHGPEDALANALVAAAAEGPDSVWRALVMQQVAQSHLMADDIEAAAAATAESIAVTSPAGSNGFYALALQASIEMRRGDWPAAEAAARDSHLRLSRMGSAAAASFVLVHAVTARVAIHHGDVARGRDELVHAQLVRPLMSSFMPSLTVMGSMEVARGYLALADPAGAGAALAEAERVLRRRPALGVLGAQVAAIRHRVHETVFSIAGASTLTPAELRLLPFLSTHLMAHEIAERLGVSRHTVKTQVMAIYGKLGASTRSEAVDRAIEVGLLEPFPGMLEARPLPGR